MNWDFVIRLFKSYLITEKGLSNEFCRGLFTRCSILLRSQYPESLPTNIKTDDIEQFSICFI
jgi:hypothetical protein